MNTIDIIDNALTDLQNGKMIIVTDNADRENEGDFVMAAEKTTPEAVNFMATYGRGLICTPLSQEIASRLNLPPMVNTNNSSHATAFTVSVDGKDSGTGISSADRALTIKMLADKKTRATDLLRPGHIFPLVANNKGLNFRQGHTEATVELMEMAGLEKVGMICEIMNEDGTMSRRTDLQKLSKNHNIKLISIEQILEYKNKKEKQLKLITIIDLPTKFGEFKLYTFQNNLKEYHLAIIKGDITGRDSVLTRIHSECLTGDVFGSDKCDCGSQLEESMKLIEENGAGIILYMKQEGRGIGLIEKIKAYKLQEEGMDTVEANIHLGHEADSRSYDDCAQILTLLDVDTVELMTNNPDKIKSLEENKIKVIKRKPLDVGYNKSNYNYLLTKKNKFNHFIMSDLH
ncbi:MAG: 3,4-dihydroxy-2-butanone-4-phosphate synthase [Bdellovibrionales bacterium]|nr:3,4-dihydroxy-2-butanone-4-phosphate synthase [Bdellovibrionales bacterium]